jgi:hypothetical protein
MFLAVMNYSPPASVRRLSIMEILISRITRPFDVVYYQNLRWPGFPAILVHLWLPLLLLAGNITYGINTFFKTVGFAQWFIKRGSSHPLNAIGMVAAAVAFVVAAAWQGISYLAFRLGQRASAHRAWDFSGWMGDVGGKARTSCWSLLP